MIHRWPATQSHQHIPSSLVFLFDDNQSATKIKRIEYFIIQLIKSCHLWMFVLFHTTEFDPSNQVPHTATATELYSQFTSIWTNFFGFGFASVNRRFRRHRTSASLFSITILLFAFPARKHQIPKIKQWTLLTLRKSCLKIDMSIDRLSNEMQIV